MSRQQHRSDPHALSGHQQQQQQHQQAPPAMYDTSISTTESTSYSSHRSHTQFYPKSHPRQAAQPSYNLYANKQQQQQQQHAEAATSWTSAPVQQHRDAGMVAAASQYTNRVSSSGSNNSNKYSSGSRQQQRSSRPQVLQEEPVVAMSEPGVGYQGGQSMEQDRFAAYINRFAEMDPRMDYRGSSQQSLNSSFHSNNSNGNSNTMRPTTTTTTPADTNTSSRQRQQSEQDKKMEQRLHMTVSERIRKINHSRVAKSASAAATNFPDPEPSLQEMMDDSSQHGDDNNNGNDDPLLPVFEHMTRRSPAAAQRRDPSRERQMAVLQQHQLQQREASGREQNVALQQQRRRDESPAVEPSGRSPGRSPGQSPGRSSEATSPSSRTRDLARRFEQRSSPSTRGTRVAAPQFANGPPDDGNVAPPAQSQHGERQQQRSVSPPPEEAQHRQSRSQRQEQQPESSRRSSTSLPPGRRRRPLQHQQQQQAPCDPSLENSRPSHEEELLPDLNELAARGRYDYAERAEIETPQPARVQDLRQKLWDTNESLQVAGRASPGRGGREDQQQESQHWSTAQRARASRSLSPKASRVRMEEQVAVSEVGGSKMFKSRYYEAAAAARRSMSSPDRSASTAGRAMASQYSHQSKATAESARQIYTKLSEEEKEDNLRSIRNKYTIGEGSPEATNEPPASLVARLNAVNRANPDEALAQIDAILRAESRSTNGDVGLAESPREMGTPPAGGGGRIDQTGNPAAAVAVAAAMDESSEEESDDDTSVSSITNPTYQSAKAIADPAKHPISNASGGRPRPSSLQAYANTTPYSKLSSTGEPNVVSSRDRPSKSKSKKTRSPPPATIRLSASKEKSKKVAETAESDRRARDGSKLEQQHRTLAATEEETERSSPATKRSSVVDSAVFKRLGGLLSSDGNTAAIGASDSAELAEKIRRWDDMSNNGNVPGSPDPYTKSSSAHAVGEKPRGTNPFDDDESDSRFGAKAERTAKEVLPGRPVEVRSTGAETLGSIVTDARLDDDRSRRQHPWDASIPVSMGKVDMKETSMDLGDGVEARFTPKYDDVEEKLPDGSPVRRMRRNRLSAPMGMLKKGPIREEEPTGLPSKSNVNESFSGDDFDVDPKLMISEGDNEGGGWEVKAEGYTPPRQENAATSRRQENANNMSNDFDSAWVALPSSTFFGDKGMGKDKTSLARTTTRRNTKRDTSDIPPQISVTLSEDENDKRRAPIQKFSPEMQEPARISNYTPPERSSREMRPPTAYDEGLVGGETTDEEEMAGIEVALVEPPVVSPGRTETRGRRGLRGLLKRRSNSKGVASRVGASSEVGSPSRQFNSSALLRKSLDPITGEIAAPPSRSRARRTSKSPSRDRARSLEERRTRNPNLAKKFSRLMRLYDDGDKNEVGYI